MKKKNEAGEMEEVKEVEVKEVKVEETKVDKKTVKVLMKSNHRCSIGGEWYSFLKGKQYFVPEFVKEILKRDDLISPL